MSEKHDRLVRLATSIPDAYLHIDLGYVDSPTSDIHRSDNDRWLVSSETWADLSIEENIDDISLFIKIDLDELDDDALVERLKEIIETVRGKKNPW